MSHTAKLAFAVSTVCIFAYVLASEVKDAWDRSKQR